jgi:hypothetical protein
MQLHLETDELNLLANILLERVGTISTQASSSGSPQSDGNLGQGPRFFDDILDKVLARDLRLDSDELEGVADLLRIRLDFCRLTAILTSYEQHRIQRSAVNFLDEDFRPALPGADPRFGRYASS